LGLTDRPPCIDHEQQCSCVATLGIAFAVAGKHGAGEPNQVV
jgi:hypothetical protein